MSKGMHHKHHNNSEEKAIKRPGNRKDDPHKSRFSTLLNSLPHPSKKSEYEAKTLKSNAKRENSSLSTSPVTITPPANGSNRFDDFNEKRKTERIIEESETIRSIKQDLDNMKSMYRMNIQTLLNDNINMRNEIQDIRNEFANCLQSHCSLFRSMIDKMDVELQILIKMMNDLQEHYGKFVPFAMENILAIIKRIEYLNYAVHLKQTENRNVPYDDLFRSFKNSCGCSSKSNSGIYSISISHSTEKDHYKIIFDPVDNVSVSQFSEEAKEQVLTIPYVKTPTKQTKLHYSFSDPSNVRQTRQYGSNTYAYNNYGNYTFKFSQPNSNSEGSIGSSTLLHGDSYSQMDVTPGWSAYRDTKKRYLNMKYIGLKCNTFPIISSINARLKGHVNVNLNVLSDNQSCDSVFEQDPDQFICQSDTDLHADKFFTDSKVISSDSYINVQQKKEMILYEKISQKEFECLKQFKDISNYRTKNSNFEEKFSLILPRSKLSSILANNFTNISSILQASDDDINETFDYERPVEYSNYKLYNTYFTFDNNFSENETYIDDDYSEQQLCHQPNGLYNSDYLDYSTDRLFEELENFQLPESTTKIF